jgi:UPF0755 protein
MKRLILLVVLLAAAAAVALLFLPYGGFGRETFVDIPRGTGTRAIGRILAHAGVIRHEGLFLLIRALRPAANLKAGEYRFDRPATPFEVFDRIARGDVFLYALVVPEGHNLFDIADHLANEKLMTREGFIAAARDPALVRDLAPRAPSLEGYLFPDTYHFPRKTTPEQLAKLMTDRFRKAWQQLGSPKVDVHELVTLASLVEKEARVGEERPLVASVYVNRLKIGMPLQCDPTTIYAALLENRFRGAIYRSDLDRAHPYNTYQNPGLPPGPIANPGLEALRAALKPAQTEYLYFVARADGSGAHQFSTGLAEHSRAVQQYRRALKQADSSREVARGTQAAPDQPGRPAATQAPPRSH